MFDVFEQLIDLHRWPVMFNIATISVQPKTQTDSAHVTYFDFTVETVPELNSITLNWCSINCDSRNSRSSTALVKSEGNRRAPDNLQNSTYLVLRLLVSCL